MAQSLAVPFDVQLRQFSQKHLPAYAVRLLKYHFVIWMLKKIMCYERVQDLQEALYNKTGLDYVDSMIDSLDISVSNENLEKIPASGRLIVVANHPMGGTDILSLLQCIGKVRKDAKLTINKFASTLLSNLGDLCIPVDMHVKGNGEARKLIAEHLENEEAVLFFPSGAISKLTFKGLRDRKWKNGVVHFAREHNVDILPVYIDGRFHLRFYLYPKVVRSFLYVKKFLNPRKELITVRVGDIIPFEELLEKKEVSQGTSLIRNRLYELRDQLN